MTPKERDNLIIDFCEALSKINDCGEAAHFLKDLLSPPEIEMLAKRLKIARLLIEGYSNTGISEELGVSRTTVSRIGVWLRTSGEGYRLISKRIPKEVTVTEKERIQKAYKMKFSKYYWPELLWDALTEELSDRKKRKIKSIIQSGNKKIEIFKELEIIFKRGGNVQ